MTLFNRLLITAAYISFAIIVLYWAIEALIYMTLNGVGSQDRLVSFPLPQPPRFYAPGLLSRYLSRQGGGRLKIERIHWLEGEGEVLAEKSEKTAGESSSSSSSSPSSDSWDSSNSRPFYRRKKSTSGVIAHRQRSKPNIVLIVVDDFGYNDLNRVDTPHIRSIYGNGVRFDKTYSGSATCAPSRAAIVTGRYPTRFGFEFTPVPLLMADFLANPLRKNKYDDHQYHSPIAHRRDYVHIPPMSDMIIPKSEVFMSEVLKDIGYRNYHLGKWHLGEVESATPRNRGYHESLSFLSGASLYLPEDHEDVVNARLNNTLDEFLWTNLQCRVQHNNGPYLVPDLYMTDYLAREAESLMQAHAKHFDDEVDGSVPFFIHLNFNAPHNPLQALKSDYDSLGHIANHVERVYSAMIMSLDRGVGRVIQALKDINQYENTLLIFTSDNGGAGYIGVPDVNKPFRGFKCTFFEGGLRVPLFIQWPLEIGAGQVIEDRVSHVDIFATIVDSASRDYYGGNTSDIANSWVAASKSAWTSSATGDVLDVSPNIFYCRYYDDDANNFYNNISSKSLSGRRKLERGDLRSIGLAHYNLQLDGVNLLRGVKKLDAKGYMIDETDYSCKGGVDNSIDRGGSGDKSTVKSKTKESKSSSKSVLSETKAKSERLTNRLLFFRSGHYRSVIKDDWKLQVSFLPLHAWLFNLKADPLETTNLLDKNEWFTRQVLETSGLRPELFSKRVYEDSKSVREGNTIWVIIRRIVRTFLAYGSFGSREENRVAYSSQAASSGNFSNEFSINGMSAYNSTLNGESLEHLQDLWAALVDADATAADPLWPAAMEYSIAIDANGGREGEFVYWSN